MAQPVIQHSFHAGEWAPNLNARVDLAKYHAGAALLRNFFVDYRGGASSRAGTRYILKCFKSGSPVRLIPLQISATLGYVLEFGDFYIRFYNNGAPILEPTTTITGATQANPCVLTITAHPYAIGDWIFVQGVAGMTQLNGNYYIITAKTANTITIAGLDNVAINSTGYGAYTSGGTAARVFTLLSPYAAADLAKIKFTQTINTLILCHPLYVPYTLTITTPTSWAAVPINFGPTLPAPTNLTATTSSAGTWNYSYILTAVDISGQESTVSSVASSTVNAAAAASITLTWTGVSGAQSYNLYRSMANLSAVVPAGSDYGFIGNFTGVSATDAFTNGVPAIATDFTIAPPIFKNPFQGAGVDHVNVTAPGSYTTVPGVTFAAAPGGGATATGFAVIGGVSASVASSSAFAVGEILYPKIVDGHGISVIVLTVDGGGIPLTLGIVNPGAFTSGSPPTNPIAFDRLPLDQAICNVNVTWGVVQVVLTSQGAGYLSAPAVTFSAGAATATAVLASNLGGNPTVPGLYQERLVLAAKPNAVQTFDMSQPGYLYNYNISSPLQADDAISGTIVSGQLNEIKSMVSVPVGLMLLTSNANWLVNGGAGGTAVTPIDVTANAHSYNGASDLPPIVANFDILFVQQKNSIVRDLAFNFYTQIYTGTDISVLSSHLFYGFSIKEWAWAEEPFKIVWAVRNDGVMLTLTFLKEQDIIGWAHSDTNGLFKSVTVITEPVTTGNVDAVYTVVQRTVNGNTVQYVERVMERFLNGQAKNAWTVDAGLQYNGAPATTFFGAQHLAGMTVTGLADGKVIPPFTMPVSGTFTLAQAASVVTVGLAFLPQLQTLALDTGEPTIQGKMKSIPAVTVRVSETLGLSMGKTFASAVPMKDLIAGNVGSMTNQIVTDLVTGDARTFLDPSWTTPGQYCIQQPFPLPATILGVIPQLAVGDTPK